MKISVNIKSGTGGYLDYDGCDLLVEKLEVAETPRVGDTITINKEGKTLASYLVRGVNRHYNIPKENGSWKYGEHITVYVIPC